MVNGLLRLFDGVFKLLDDVFKLLGDFVAVLVLDLVQERFRIVEGFVQILLVRLLDREGTGLKGHRIVALLLVAGRGDGVCFHGLGGQLFEAVLDQIFVLIVHHARDCGGEGGIGLSDRLFLVVGFDGDGGGQNGHLKAAGCVVVIRGGSLIVHRMLPGVCEGGNRCHIGFALCGGVGKGHAPAALCRGARRDGSRLFPAVVGQRSGLAHADVCQFVCFREHSLQNMVLLDLRKRIAFGIVADGQCLPVQLEGLEPIACLRSIRDRLFALDAQERRGDGSALRRLGGGEDAVQIFQRIGFLCALCHPVTPRCCLDDDVGAGYEQIRYPKMICHGNRFARFHQWEFVLQIT